VPGVQRDSLTQREQVEVRNGDGQVVVPAAESQRESRAATACGGVAMGRAWWVGMSEAARRLEG
jgi:hypothetical protein